MSNKESREFIKEQKIVPVVKLDKLSDAYPVIGALCEGGIKVAEITYRTSCAGQAIKMTRSSFPDALIGAGTVVSKEQCREAIRAGAQFIVSPGFNEELVPICEDYDVLYVPGAVTPTEIMRLMRYGIDLVKFFPAEAFGGLKAVKALSAPFPHIEFMPTGGIGAGNYQDYLAFEKIVAVGGSWMVKNSLIDEGKFDEITRLSAEAVGRIR